MIFPSPWEHAISVVRHHEYESKPSFERSSDTYEQWAAFAVTKGSFRYEIGGTSGSAAAGDLVICPPGVPFRRHADGPISFHYFLFHWLDRAGKPVAYPDYTSPVHLSYRTSDRFYSSLESLRQGTETGVNRQTYSLWRNHALLDLFRFYDAEREALSEPAAQPLSDPSMEQARGMLDDICETPTSIGLIAERCGLTPVQFARRFERASGMKPSAYVERVKLDKVCRLLTHTAMTLEQIAQASGFNNGFYLSRYFTKKMGMPPSLYRTDYRV
jgi:AraC-like DNA-binding protein